MGYVEGRLCFLHCTLIITQKSVQGMCSIEQVSEECAQNGPVNYPAENLDGTGLSNGNEMHELTTKLGWLVGLFSLNEASHMEES